ncbi:MAG: hypothetical protein NVSMB51_13160 [Solirubrobacteraceae bacterium]
MPLSPVRAVALLALAGIAAGAVSDVSGSAFWNRHAMLTSLLASTLVALFTVIAVGEALARRDRRRWGLLAQNVLFALMQSARATWTGMLQLLELAAVDPQDEGSRQEGLRMAEDRASVATACERMLADPARREHLQRMTGALSDHGGEVIARWAPVMVGAGTYAEVLDSHVELHSRLAWLTSMLQHNEPVDEPDLHATHMTRSSIAAESQVDDAGVRDLIVAIIAVAVELDEQARSFAFNLVPSDWWLQRTEGLTSSAR